jgi:competence protein ComEA
VAAWLAIAGPAAHAEPVVHASATAADARVGVVNLNLASSDELERLPGIGPAKARAIVEHRRAHPFHKVEDLTKVKGIGRKTFGKLRPYLTLVGATTLTEAPRREARRRQEIDQ